MDNSSRPGMPTFLEYNLHIWKRAAKNGAARGGGVLIGFVINSVLLAVQLLLGLYPSGNTAARWGSFIAVQFAGLLVLYLMYVWHATWQSHKEDAGIIEELRKSQLTIHSASFRNADGLSKRSVKEFLDSLKRDGLVFHVSSDALKCDPASGNPDKYLDLSYSYGDEGPFSVTRKQSEFRLVLPEDKFLLKQIQDLREHLREMVDGLPRIKQAARIEQAASEAAELKTEFQNHQASLSPGFHHPLDLGRFQIPSHDGEREMARLQAMYLLHWEHSMWATSGLSFDSDVRKYKNLAHMDWRQVIEALEQHEKLLRSHAASLLKPFSAKTTISEIDHT